MTYNEQMKAYEETMRLTKLELDEILKACNFPEGRAELDKRFCRNFGCVNFKSDEFFHELRLARLYHGLLTKAYPNEHKLIDTEPWRCYHKTTCRCGFSEAYDSGD